MKIFHTHLPNLTKLALVCLSILVVPIQSHARDASFTWTANPEPLIGYKLYYKTGTDSGEPYDGTDLNAEGSPILLGNVTMTTLTGLSPNKTYQFALTAYNEAEESGYSIIVPVQPLSFPSPTLSIISQN